MLLFWRRSFYSLGGRAVRVREKRRTKNRPRESAAGFGGESGQGEPEEDVGGSFAHPKEGRFSFCRGDKLVLERGKEKVIGTAPGKAEGDPFNLSRMKGKNSSLIEEEENLPLSTPTELKTCCRRPGERRSLQRAGRHRRLERKEYWKEPRLPSKSASSEKK